MTYYLQSVLRVFTLCVAANYHAVAFANEEPYSFSKYGCFKRQVAPCEDKKDFLRIASKLTALSEAQIQKFADLTLPGQDEKGYSAAGCHFSLMFLSRRFADGLSGVPMNRCASIKLAEYLQKYTWKEFAEEKRYDNFGSLLSDPLAILDGHYLGNWPEAGSLSGNKVAQCYKSLETLERVLEFDRKYRKTTLSKKGFGESRFGISKFKEFSKIFPEDEIHHFDDVMIAFYWLKRSINEDVKGDYSTLMWKSFNKHISYAKTKHYDKLLKDISVSNSCRG